VKKTRVCFKIFEKGKNMKLTEKIERFSNGSRRFVGRYKKWSCNIIYHESNWYDKNSYWCFTCDKGEDSYNSLWHGLKFSSKEEAHDTSVEYIDRQEKIK